MWERIFVDCISKDLFNKLDGYTITVSRILNNLSNSFFYFHLFYINCQVYFFLAVFQIHSFFMWIQILIRILGGTIGNSESGSGSSDPPFGSSGSRYIFG